MTTRVQAGQVKTTMSRDADGHREYRAEFRVISDDPSNDGPAVVLTTFGLPQPGDPWQFGSAAFGPANDNDPWATCKQLAQVEPELSGEPNQVWKVTLTFSTKGDDKRCKDEQIDDPLLKPPEISGSFTKYTEEVQADRFGEAIQNSAYEPFKGPQVQFDKNRPQVTITQNVADLQYGVLSQFQDCVNAFAMWGLPPRAIKLSTVRWSKKFWGTCEVYYERSATFDVAVKVNPVDGGLDPAWDRDLLDTGTKVLNGHWKNFNSPALKVGSGATAHALMTDDGTGRGTFKVLSVTVDSAGTGYQTAPRITFRTQKGDRNQGVLDAAGVSTLTGTGVGSISPTFAGQGYSKPPTVVITDPTSLFVLDNIGGSPPDPNNPQHFVQAMDRFNQPFTVVLDGAGKPAGICAGAGAVVTLTTSPVTGAVSAAVVTTPGSGYDPDNPPDIVVFQDAFVLPPGLAAVLEPVIDPVTGALLEVNIIDPGEGYTAAQAAVIAPLTTQGEISLEYYPGVDFFLLGGLPAVLFP